MSVPCRRTLQAAAGRRRSLYSNIVVSSCGGDRRPAALMWPSWLTVDHYETIHTVKIPTILLEIVSCGGLWHPAVIGRTQVVCLLALVQFSVDISRSRQLYDDKAVWTRVADIIILMIKSLYWQLPSSYYVVTVLLSGILWFTLYIYTVCQCLLLVMGELYSVCGGQFSIWQHLSFDSLQSSRECCTTAL